MALTFSMAWRSEPGPASLVLVTVKVTLGPTVRVTVPNDTRQPTFAFWQPGPGNLLGNLLCSVAHLLDNNGPLAGLQTLLNQLNMLLGGL